MIQRTTYHKVVFQPEGIHADVEEGTDILQAAREAGVQIDAVCGGASSCGKCRVRVPETAFSGSRKVSPVTSIEKILLTEEERKAGWRLACKTRVYGDLKVEIPSKGLRSDCVILTDTVSTDSGLKDSLLSDPFLTKSDLTGSDKDDSAFGDPIPGKLTGYHCGAAVDLGTTTLAAYLYQLDTEKQLASASMMNPQILYGDDVISRITYCSAGSEEEKQQHLKQLQTLICSALDSLFQELADRAGIMSEQISECVLVCNTVMEHIFLGISPECLGHSPFTPSVKESVELSADRACLHSMKPDGSVHILPAADGFIGADHIAVLLQEQPWLYPDRTLVVDIGTNTEICLCTKGSMYVTSCATGPALEGAQIRYGMRASSGAVDHVVIDPATLEPDLHWIGKPDVSAPAGICGSGIIDLAAQMYTTGMLQADGTFSPYAVSERIRTDENGQKEYVIYDQAEENPSCFPGCGKISVTQEDIRAVLLAKAALYAGIRMLFKHSGCDHADRVLLAGAFGCFLDVKNALRLGLLPDILPGMVTSVGNAAGAGASLALLDSSKRKEAEEIVDRIQFVDSVSDPDFQKYYADAMLLPHRKDSFQKSFPIIWKCSGTDTRFMPEAVCRMDFSVLEDPDQMLSVSRQIQEYNREPFPVLPVVQNLEACALGADVTKKKNYWSPGDYPFSDLNELYLRIKSEEQNPAGPMQTGRKPFDLISDSRILAAAEAIRRSEEPVILEMEAPFSVLSALVNPKKIFAAARRDPVLTETILKRIADAEISWLEMSVKAGCKLVSLADPVGSPSIVGKRVFQKTVAPSELYFLRKSRRFLKSSVLHLCGQMSVGLLEYGYAVCHPVRLNPDAGYQKSLMTLASDPKIRFMGLGCMHARGDMKPIGYTIELT